MFNLKKYVFLLLVTTIPSISPMEFNSDTEDKMGKTYKRLPDPEVFRSEWLKTIGFPVTEDIFYSFQVDKIEEFCIALKRHILLPDILEDLYKSYEDMEWYRYIWRLERFHCEKSNEDKNEIAKYQDILDLRFKLHNKRIELFALSKTLKDK